MQQRNTCSAGEYSDEGLNFSHLRVTQRQICPWIRNTRKDKIEVLEMEAHRHDSGYEDDRFQVEVGRNFHCPICMNVFKDPVMCQRNQHCFCRPCITRHLRNSQTCPTCIEELNVETLKLAPRIFNDCLCELNIRCDYFDRGCLEFVQLGNLKPHVNNCGFGPVVCSNEGCLVEINKRDQTHHETEVCEFRKVKCHDCGESKEDMDKVKLCMMTLTEKLEEVEKNQRTVITKMRALDDEVKTIVRNQTALNGELEVIRNEIKRDLKEIKDQFASLSHRMVHNIQLENEKMANRIEEAKTGLTEEKIDVVIAGGYKCLERLSSVEKFCWSTKSWARIQPMKEGHEGASSFVFNNQIFVAGGYTRNGRSDTMERVKINSVMVSEPWFDFPAKLPAKLSGHSCVLHDGKLIVIGGFDGKQHLDSIHEVLLVPPYTSKLLTRMPETRSLHGAQLFNDKILICGGWKTGRYRYIADSVILYDISKNECKQMSPLPYAVSNMATVSWGDNVIVIGGADSDGRALSTVIIYNVETEKSHMLPVMKFKRRGCVAVVVGNNIVVMGGKDEDRNCTNSVESFSFESYSWKDLPSMNEARYSATAVAW